MLGLKTAVVSGDLRIIYLLFWAGLRERFDVETLIWVVQNTKNRVQVIEEIFNIWAKLHEMDNRELSLIGKAMAEIKYQAVIESDKAALAFVEAISRLFEVAV